MISVLTAIANIALLGSTVSAWVAGSLPSSHRKRTVRFSTKDDGDTTSTTKPPFFLNDKIPSTEDILSIEEQILAEHAELESFLSDNSQQVEENTLPASAHKETDIPFFLRIKSGISSVQKTDTLSNVPFFLEINPHADAPSSVPFFLEDAPPPVTPEEELAVDTSFDAFQHLSPTETDDPPLHDLVDMERQFQELLEYTKETVASARLDPAAIANNVLPKDRPKTEQRDTDLHFETLILLATLGRIPYFAYLSVMHLKETFGDRGPANDSTANDDNNASCRSSNLNRIETMRMHFARADNEFHHLEILEDLGGANEPNQWIARSLSVLYFWTVAGLFCWNETRAYQLQRVVAHKVFLDVFEKFLVSNESELRARPVPDSARNYYEVDFQKDSYLFDAIASNNNDTENDARISDHHSNPRRPHPLDSLYDVLWNIYVDEKDHLRSLDHLVLLGEDEMKKKRKQHNTQ